MEIVRYGRFAVLDQGPPISSRERDAARPRYAVVEYDALGPILRAGPYHLAQHAIEKCQAMDFSAELREVSHARHG